MCYRLYGWVSIPDRDKGFFLLHSVQTGSEAYPVSCPMGARGSSLGGKEAEA
jgi:hypothetical protein